MISLPEYRTSNPRMCTPRVLFPCSLMRHCRSQRECSNFNFLEKLAACSGHLETPIHRAKSVENGTAAFISYLMIRQLCTAKAVLGTPCVFGLWLSHVLTSDF